MRRQLAARPSSTANLEMLEDDTLLGVFGDYTRLSPIAKRVPSPRRVSVADLQAAS